MLPTMQFVLMAIYYIIQSGQQKKHAVLLCQERPRKTTPLKLTKQQRRQLIPNSIHHVPQRAGTILTQWATLSVCAPLCVHACVHSLAFVCTFHVLTEWPAAVLESLLTESVGSAGYFYTLACMREQVEALWNPSRSCHNLDFLQACSDKVLSRSQNKTVT